jgi:hypothetical protein
MSRQGTEFFDPSLPTLDRVRVARGGVDPMPSTRLGKLQPALSSIATRADSLVSAFLHLPPHETRKYGDLVSVSTGEIWSRTVGGGRGQLLGREVTASLEASTVSSLRIERGTFVRRRDGFNERVDFLLSSVRSLSSDDWLRISILSKLDASYGRIQDDGKRHPDYRDIRLKVVMGNTDGDSRVISGAANRYKNAERYRDELEKDIVILADVGSPASSKLVD